MADLVKNSKLSTGVLGMRFMQRKAEAELAQKLGGSQDSQWTGSIIQKSATGAKKGPIIVYEQRRDHGAARSYSRRSFGSFNTTVEEQEKAELQADQGGAAAADGGGGGAAAAAATSDRPSKRSKLAHTKLEEDDDEVAQPRFREPEDSAATSCIGERAGAWRGKLEEKRSTGGSSGRSDSSAGRETSGGGAGDGTVTGGSSKKKKKKKRKMSSTSN